MDWNRIARQALKVSGSCLTTVTVERLRDYTHFMNRFRTDHQTDDLVRCGLGGDTFADFFTAAHNDDAVCDREDILHVVADDDDRHTLTG